MYDIDRYPMLRWAILIRVKQRFSIMANSNPICYKGILLVALRKAKSKVVLHFTI